MNMDDLIKKMFEENWSGDYVKSSLENMKMQLYKNLKNQLEGYWSGRTAYYIMTKGGFLIDSKSGSTKELTELGKMFMEDFQKERSLENYFCTSQN